MKMRNAAIAIAVIAGLSATRALAQQEEHRKDQAAPSVAVMDRASADKAGGMMSGGMLMGQNETSELLERLISSFAAIRNEKDPTAVKAKLAEHGALLNELRAKVQAQSHMLDVMQHIMVGSMMDGIMMDGKMINGKLMRGAPAGGENKK